MPVSKKVDLPPRYVYEGDPLSEPPPAALAEILDGYRGQQDALITVLEEIQQHYSYLPQDGLLYTARELGFPLSQVYGAATFYNLFRFSPPGRYVVRLCKGTACHVRHTDANLDFLKEKLGIGENETTPDGLFTLQTVACVGACSLAPVMVVNDTTHGNMTPEKAWELLSQLPEGAVNHPEGEEVAS